VLPVARRVFILSVSNTALVESIQPADDIMIFTAPSAHHDHSVFSIDAPWCSSVYTFHRLRCKRSLLNDLRDRRSKTPHRGFDPSSISGANSGIRLHRAKQFAPIRCPARILESFHLCLSLTLANHRGVPFWPCPKNGHFC
jgi:hypothetical protein